MEQRDLPPIERFKRMNQFVVATPKNSYVHDDSDRVLLNVLTGCTVTQCYDSISNGFLKRPSRVPTDAVLVSWQEKGTHSASHSFRIEGKDLEKFEEAMLAQSLSLDADGSGQ